MVLSADRAVDLEEKKIFRRQCKESVDDYLQKLELKPLGAKGVRDSGTEEELLRVAAVALSVEAVGAYLFFAHEPVRARFDK